MNLMFGVKARFVSDEFVLAGEAAVAANPFLGLLYYAGAPVCVCVCVFFSERSTIKVASYGFVSCGAIGSVPSSQFKGTWRIQSKTRAMHHFFRSLVEAPCSGAGLSMHERPINKVFKERGQGCLYIET